MSDAFRTHVHLRSSKHALYIEEWSRDKLEFDDIEIKPNDSKFPFDHDLFEIDPEETEFLGPNVTFGSSKINNRKSKNIWKDLGVDEILDPIEFKSNNQSHNQNQNQNSDDNNIIMNNELIRQRLYDGDRTILKHYHNYHYDKNNDNDNDDELDELLRDPPQAHQEAPPSPKQKASNTSPRRVTHDDDTPVPIQRRLRPRTRAASARSKFKAPR